MYKQIYNVSVVLNLMEEIGGVEPKKAPHGSDLKKKLRNCVKGKRHLGGLVS